MTRFYRSFLLFSCLTLIAPLIRAQNGRYDLRFKLATFDCIQRRAVVQVQVRATDTYHIFKMGDANYRFEYDPRLLSVPYIVSEDAFSSARPSLDFNYQQQNLNGSSEGTSKALTSLNTFYSGAAGGAKTVDTAWTTITSIGFDVLEIDSCFSLKWHDNSTFPATGMNEIVPKPNNAYEFDAHIASASGYFGNLQFCAPAACRTQGSRIRVSPVASADSVKTSRNISVQIEVLKNDSLNGTLQSIGISNKPKHGSAVPTANNTIIYTPNKEYCGADQFMYSICNNSGGCDSAAVYVNIGCNGIVVNNGFSPNGDGINDYLSIQGLETFPNNELSIFNARGALVFHSKHYLNDWGGKWNGHDLDHGTYFYVLEDGERRTFSGYIQIER